MNEATCKSCGAPILWCPTAAGAKLPLDAAPDPKGNILIVDGVADVHSVIPAEYRGRRYTTHFVTCKNARQHRKARRTPPSGPGLFGDTENPAQLPD